MKINDYIKQRRIELGISLADVAKAVGVSEGTVSRWESGHIDDMKRGRISALASVLKISPIELILDDKELEPTGIPSNTVRINVFRRIHAGIPMELQKDIAGSEDIPCEWTTCGEKYFGFKVAGDSMYPKYQDGDRVIVRCLPDCKSGEDAIVCVDGPYAELRRVINDSNGIILQPLNPDYAPKKYYFNDPDINITTLGVVVEIRRRV